MHIAHFRFTSLNPACNALIYLYFRFIIFKILSILKKYFVFVKLFPYIKPIYRLVIGLALVFNGDSTGIEPNNGKKTLKL